jgi:hypothetical protein
MPTSMARKEPLTSSAVLDRYRQRARTRVSGPDLEARMDFPANTLITFEAMDSNRHFDGISESHIMSEPDAATVTS